MGSQRVRLVLATKQQQLPEGLKLYTHGSLLHVKKAVKTFGEGNGNPLQYPCLENPMDGVAWYATVHGVAESDTTHCLHVYPIRTHTPTTCLWSDGRRCFSRQQRV